jgi:2-keto-4-pentenoate hydratase/2-oxohepta-3-ene-1,7-dioic acid hydratase in catechol pathway
MTSQQSADLADFSLVRWRRHGGGSFTGGLVHGQRLWSLADVPGIDGDVLRACLVAQEDGGVHALLDRVSDQPPTDPLSLDEVELGPPLTNPDKILCLGLNYTDHASEAGFDAPTVPIIFSKFRNCLIGPRDSIVMPRASSDIDFEGELAVVIGRTAKYVGRDEALQHVTAYSVFNDVTARDLQLRTSQWISGKALDTFAPMGPGLVPAELVPDPQDLMIRTKVNDEVMQHDSTAHMIFDVAGTIAYLSNLMTLEPGDVIATGTPAGVGFKQEPPRFLSPGDVVEVSIAGIGTIRNPVVAEVEAQDGAAAERVGTRSDPLASSGTR